MQLSEATIPHKQPTRLCMCSSLLVSLRRLSVCMMSQLSSRVMTRVAVSSAPSTAASSVPRRYASDSHGPTDNWPQSQEELRYAHTAAAHQSIAVTALHRASLRCPHKAHPAQQQHSSSLMHCETIKEIAECSSSVAVLSSRVVCRRLWGYGLATLGVFLYAAYSISGPAPKKTTTTTTTTTTKH